MSGKKVRAMRVTAPGAQRVTFTGVLAAPDSFGRLRVLLVDELRDGTRDFSWAALVNELSQFGGTRPYELWADGTDREGIRGEAWIVVPGRHRQHWADVAAALRGKEVRVEATVRPYRFERAHGGGAGPAAALAAEIAVAPETLMGCSLDLAMLEARVASATSAGRRCERPPSRQ